MKLLSDFLQSSKTEWQNKKPGLERIQKACELFNHPEKKIPSIHIAGTNGKGSTAAMLQSILTEAGYKVGLFTSPHLVRVNERFRIGNEEISDEELEEILNSIQVKIPLSPPLHKGDREHLSFFELCTLIAFLYFAKHQVDLAVIEVGLGGRLDSTNVITPLISVITEIGLDHTEVLGNSIAEIAREKAGIIKPGVPVVCGATKLVAVQVIQELAGKNKSEFFLVGAIHESPLQYSLKLLGPHQKQNAAIVLQTLKVLREKGWKVSEHSIRKGFQNLRWPGRLEIVSEDPLIILDGAHNKDGMEALVKALTSPQPSPYQRRGGVFWKILFSAASDKNVGEMLKTLSQISSEITLCEMESSRSINPVLIQKQYPELPLENGGKGKEAFLNAKKNLQESEGLLVTGSLYWVGEVKQVLSFEKG